MFCGGDQHYDVQLDTDEIGQRATAVRFTRSPLAGTMMTHPGVYCLRSSKTGWDEATLWRTYSTLTDLEAVFRSLKSELGLSGLLSWDAIPDSDLGWSFGIAQALGARATEGMDALLNPDTTRVFGFDDTVDSSDLLHDDDLDRRLAAGGRARRRPQLRGPDDGEVVNVPASTSGLRYRRFHLQPGAPELCTRREFGPCRAGRMNVLMTAGAGFIGAVLGPMKNGASRP